MRWRPEADGPHWYGPGIARYGFQAAPGPYDDPYGAATLGSLFSEAEEMELAAELLGITDEAELDQFLGKMFRKVGRFFTRSPIGRALGGALKGIAKTVLPMAGAALGSFVAPGIGTAIGGQLGSAASKLLGKELDGLSPEDQEFEVARHYVRLAGEAARLAASAPSDASPEAVAQQAIATAAQRHAPGLVAGMHSAQRRGIWMRRGRNIVLYGA
jgi:hypothetical protein